MKKSFLKKCTLFMALILAFSVLLTGCDLPWEEPEIYKLSYAIDGKIYEIEVKHGENYHLEEIPQREGYDFSGLFDTEEGGTKYVSSSGLCVSAFTDDKNMILYPRWEAKRFTLQLNYGKASDAGLRTLDIAYDQEVQGLPEELDVIGENFLGWYTAQDTSGTKIENGMLMNKTLSALADANGRITLYALFETTKYNVRFYSYDGNTLLEETQVEHGTDISEVAPKALSDGTEILGWSTSRNGFGYDFVGEITGTVTSFYVKYYNCTLTLDPANGDPTQTFTGRNGRDQTLPQPTRTGYTLQGWENEEGKRIDPYVPYRPSKSETLTAKWSPNTYTVTFSVDENIATLQGGEGETSTAKTTFDEEYKFPKPTVTDDLYTFMGWFTEKDVQLTDEEGNGLGKWHIDGDITAVARFSKIQYTVSFFTGGGSSVPSKTVDKGSSVQLPKPTFAGYTFGGWKTADGNILQGESFTPSSSVTLTAVWDPNEYTVTLQTDGGKLSGSSETKVKVTFGKAFSLPPASKENFEFLGWYDRSTQLTNANGVGLAVWNIAEDVTLTAQYRRIEYTITFNTNGGTSVGAKTAYKGEPMELPACTKEGYTFNYWKTSSGTKLTSPYMATGSITLYADWTANTYTISFNVNGGSLSDGTKQVTYGSAFSLPVPTREGYTFDGWFYIGKRVTDKMGNGVSEWNIASSVAVSAGWNLLPAEVFNATIRTGSHKINGSGHYTTDTFTLTKDLEMMRTMGFSKLTVTVNYEIKEVDNCYQKIYLYDSEGVSIWSEKIEHGGSSTNKNWGTHSFTCEISLSSLKSNVWTFKCQAENAIFKDFYIGTVSVTVTAMP